MLGLAGIPLGERFTFLDPNPNAPAAAVGRVITGDFDDPAALAELAAVCDVVTYEFEQVPAASVERLLEDRTEVYPGPRPLAAAQDRLEEKQLFVRLGLGVPRFAPVDSGDELRDALGDLGAPAVLKTRSGGYDGKGQLVLRSGDDPHAAVAALGGGHLLLEEHVEFERELSLLAARGRDGATAIYPLVENMHRDGILRTSRAPAPDVDAGLQRRAEEHVRKLLDALDYVGVVAIELFDAGGDLVANEIAPRVHNSGHWTIEGAVTSQFENHVRAVRGRPLGDAAARGHSVMLNLIGEVGDVDALLRLGGHVHLYDKEPRPGRKVGHVTFTDDDAERLEARVARARSSLGW